MTPGTRLGPYEVLALLGVGGMGEVYRARDTKLDRDVALKILPELFASDADRLMRFEREAKMLASLNHPQIAQIYGFEQTPSTSALVMELVEGEDLSQRIARGPIPIDEARPIAQQIAEALEVAHDAGIIHRDLKPANIKVRPDGTVKILDFGLASATRSEARAGSDAHGGKAAAGLAATITSPALVTAQGMILGTAAYMSPEQAKGKPIDRRSDIWAFGCVLFEMLTAKRAFAGDEVSDTMVAIFRDDPDWSALPRDTPQDLRELIARCLEKDPRKRLPHIGVARLELAAPRVHATPPSAMPPPVARMWRRLAPAAVGVALGAALAGAALTLWRGTPPPQSRRVPVRFSIELPDGVAFAGAAPRLAISRDGRSVVYHVVSKGSSQLWLRHMDATASVPVRGPEEDATGNDLQQPFWSPDGGQVAFFTESTSALRKVTLQTGVVETLARIPGNQYQGTWHTDGTILMASTGTRGLQRVSSAGGPVTQVTTLAEHEVNHLWPDFAPDGRHFVYLSIAQRGAASGVFVGSLDGGAPKRLFDSNFSARFAAPDWLLFVRDDDLVAQRFDFTRLELVGEPVLAVNNILRTSAGRIAVSASDTGAIVFAQGEAELFGGRVAWVDRSGSVMPQAVQTPVAVNGMRLSPDGRLLAHARQGDGGAGMALWLQELVRGVETQLPVEIEVGRATAFVFSPDGSRLVVGGPSVGNGALSLVQTSGAEAATPLEATAKWRSATPRAWSADGKQLLFSGNRNGQSGVWIMPMQSLGEPVPYLLGPGVGLYGADISPDGRWAVYTAGLTSAYRGVFVQAFPNPGPERWPVGGPGAAFPRWSKHGREIVFMDANGQLMAVPFKAEPRVELGRTTPLFPLPASTTLAPFDLTADGERFIVLQRPNLPFNRLLTVAIDWMEHAAKP